MTAPAAKAGVYGTYHDLRPIKTRKVVQLVIEVPVELAPRIVEAFGWPNAHTEEVWLAVGRLDPERVEDADARLEPEAGEDAVDRNSRTTEEEATCTGADQTSRKQAENDVVPCTPAPPDAGIDPSLTPDEKIEALHKIQTGNVVQPEAAPGQASAKTGRSRPVPEEAQQLVDDPVRQSVDCWRLCNADDFRRYLKAEYEDVWRKTMRDADMSINKFAGAVVSNLCSTHTRAAFDYHGEPRRIWMSLRTMYGYWRTAQGLDRDSAEQRMGEADG